jgi:hypothetical protein
MATPKIDMSYRPAGVSASVDLQYEYIPPKKDGDF